MKWFEIIIFILSLIGVFYYLLRLRLKEEAYLKKKTKEAISQEMRASLEKESMENKRKKEKFEKIMKDFGVKEN